MRSASDSEHEHLLALMELIEAGRVMPLIDRTHPLDETAEAMSYIETERRAARW